MFSLCFIIFKLLLYFIYIFYLYFICSDSVYRRNTAFFICGQEITVFARYAIRYDGSKVNRAKYPSPRIASHVSNEWQTLHAVL